VNTHSLIHPPRWARCLLALLGGALVPLSLAPFDIWPLAIIALALFALLLHAQSSRAALFCAFCFGVGLYGAGVSWIYVSIHTYGGASALLAALLTALFVIFIAAIFSLPYALYAGRFNRSGAGLLIGFPAFWVLGEWLRSWLLTGFPWLYLGYGHLNTWLAGWAPLAGVMGISLIVAFSAGLIAFAVIHGRARLRPLALASVICAGFWIAGAGLSIVQWTQLQDREITVGMVQPNIPQEIKWDPSQIAPTLRLLEEMSEELWQYDWVIWPEAAVPLTYHRAFYFLDRLNQQAADTGTGLITGIIYDDLREDRYYNSVVGLGDAEVLTEGLDPAERQPAHPAAEVVGRLAGGREEGRRPRRSERR
jgi:apolipoprotein N-acyltransferase